MRLRFLSLLALALVLVLSCQPGEERQFIVSLLNEVTKNDNPSTQKTLLVISSGDCGKCFSTQLRGLLETETLDGAMIVSFEGSTNFSLDEEVAELLTANSIPLYQKESSELLVEIGKYSGSPRSPYVVKYGKKELEIDALVKFQTIQPEVVSPPSSSSAPDSACRFHQSQPPDPSPHPK